jgi:TolA-binding protein
MRNAWSAGLLVLALSASLAGSFVPPAFAQMESREGIMLQNQILDLRRELDSLRAQGGVPNGGPVQTQSSMGGYGAPAYPAPDRGRGQASGAQNDLLAQLVDRISVLEDNVRQLRGQVDQLGNQQQQGNADLTKQLGDLSFRVQNLESGGKPPGGGAGPGPGPSLSPPPGNLGGGGPVPHRTPEMALQEGNAALARRDYPAAEAAAREVINGHGPRAVDGQFLLAQAMTGQRNFAAAAVAYNDAYERAHTGTHAQDSLLGLANALVALNDNRSACDALAKLRAEFPNPRGDLRDPVAATRVRANCR